MTTIVHLSDIHYGDDFIPWAISRRRGFRKRPSAETIAGLRDTLRDLKPDYVVISGDFVNKARKPCFEESANFIRNLLVNAGVHLSGKVLIVPGNHDVSFFRQPDDIRRLRGYQTFGEQLFQDSDVESLRVPFLKRCDTHRIIFLALDTTLKSLRPRAEGEIGPRQMQWMRQKLADIKSQLKIEYDRYLKVAVMHHHCVPISGEHARNERDMQLLDTADLMSVLKQNGFDLVLHGHKHVPHSTPVHREDGALLTVVGAGTALGPYLDQQGGFGNNFNLIKIDRSVSEVSVSLYHARSDGTFRETELTKYPLGRVVTEGYKTRGIRKIYKIANNGDTYVTTERRGLLVTNPNRVRKIPLRFSTESPGSISDFLFRKSENSTVEWTNPGQRIYDGFIVFDKERTVQDGEISLIYDYTITLGTMMSVSHMKAHRPNSPKSYEECVQSVASDVDELLIEIEFPRDYLIQPKVHMEKNGVSLDIKRFADKFSLNHDEGTNTWMFSMHNPPPRHDIILQWPLPQTW